MEQSTLVEEPSQISADPDAEAERDDESAGERFRNLRRFWAVTDFRQSDLARYATEWVLSDTRRGIMTMAVVSLLLQAGAAMLYRAQGVAEPHVYTYTLLALLSLHVLVSSRLIHQIEALYLLGIALLAVSASAYALLAHSGGLDSAMLMASIVLLFLVVPLVPWGLRESFAVLVLIFMLFTLSILSGQERFDGLSFWTLNVLMLASGVTACVLSANHTALWKRDIETRYDLESAQRELKKLALKDHLTGAWNRRFLESHYHEITGRFYAEANGFHFALIDINDFKQLNDSFGHELGDQVLERLAEVFTERLQSTGYFIRLGGDEFIAIFASDDPQTFVRDCAQRVGAVGDYLHPIGVSIGLVSVQAAYPQPLTCCYHEADLALYKAKLKKGKTQEVAHVEHIVLNYVVPIEPREKGHRS
ncbi:MAG: GGDEF domain-containing protein [Pseudomonadales bacterium]